MLTPRFGDGPLFPTAVLVMVASWAVAAATMLFFTYAASTRIAGRVDFIVGQTSEIDDDTESVALSRQTVRLTDGIEASLELLPGRRPAHPRGSR